MLLIIFEGAGCAGAVAPSMFVLSWFCAGLQILSKTMDSTSLSPEKVELATISKNAAGEVAQPAFNFFKLQFNF